MFAISKVRLGRDEGHKEWDTREKHRSRLQISVMGVLGMEEAKDKDFIFELLCDNAVIEAVAAREAFDSPTMAWLIRKKRRMYLNPNEKREMLRILKSVARKALAGDNFEIRVAKCHGFIHNNSSQVTS